MRFVQRPFRYSFGNASLVIIGLNVLVFFAQGLVRNATAYLALNPINVIRAGAYWQFLTYMFAHGDLGHLFMNMIALFFFGSQVERHIGSREFILYYLITGVMAGVFSFFVYWATGANNVFLLGASGAVFAILLAYATFYPNSLIYVWGILPMRAAVMVLGYTGIEIFSMLFGFRQGVAHLTHLAGFGFAYLYFLIRFGANPWHSFFGRRLP